MLPLCLELQKDPVGFVANATTATWTQLISAAREQALLGSCYYLLEDADLYQLLPEKVKNHFLSGKIYAEKQKLTILNELLQLEQIFANSGYPCVLLKGCAYRVAMMPHARGRVFSDIDLLVPQENFPDALKRLNNAGFLEFNMSDYDRRYYLRWSHQHPPLIHFIRHSSVDLHHHIYPVCSNENILVSPIFASAEPLVGSAFALPSKPIMFVHASVHLFYQDETHKLVKDIWDLFEIYQHTGQHSLLEIIAAANDLNAQAAVFYALNVLKDFYQLPLTETDLAPLAAYANPLQRRTMAKLLKHIFDQRSYLHRIAHLWWMIRGHLLKMGLATLIYHSIAKSVEQAKERRNLSKMQQQEDIKNRPRDVHN